MSWFLNRSKPPAIKISRIKMQKNPTMISTSEEQVLRIIANNDSPDSSIPDSAALANRRLISCSPISRQLVSYTASRPVLPTLARSPKLSITSCDNCACLAKLHSVFPSPWEEKVEKPLVPGEEIASLLPTKCSATFLNRAGWRTPLFMINWFDRKCNKPGIQIIPSAKWKNIHAQHTLFFGKSNFLPSRSSKEHLSTLDP